MRMMITSWRRGALLLAAAVLGLGLLTALPAGAVTAATQRAAVQPAPAAAGASQDWPTYLQNAARTNATTDGTLSTAGAPNLALDWTYQTGGPIATSASRGRHHGLRRLVGRLRVRHQHHDRRADLEDVHGRHHRPRL